MNRIIPGTDQRCGSLPLTAPYGAFTVKRNAITLVSAFPDPDAEVLALFRHRFSVEEGRRLLEARVLDLKEADAQSGASSD
jgi:hypothetical protein